MQRRSKHGRRTNAADSPASGYNIGKDAKEQMQKLIGMGLFSTEAEVAREGIRALLIQYSRKPGTNASFMGDMPDREKNAKRKQ